MFLFSWKTINRIKKLAQRDGNLCWLCSKPIDISDLQERNAHAGSSPSLDHVVERRNGGRTTIDNLRLAHRKCNNRRKDKFPHTNSESKQALKTDQVKESSQVEKFSQAEEDEARFSSPVWKYISKDFFTSLGDSKSE